MNDQLLTIGEVAEQAGGRRHLGRPLLRAAGPPHTRRPAVGPAHFYLEGALLCRFDHPATDCKVMGAEIDRRLELTS